MRGDPGLIGEQVRSSFSHLTDNEWQTLLTDERRRAVNIVIEC